MEYTCIYQCRGLLFLAGNQIWINEVLNFKINAKENEYLKRALA